ncbi:MAG: hypothetical protein M3Q78_09325 [Acidobacteriota bacterium]|nr:hypothetical protein [Acidobacteriota bacterium]
MSIAKKPLNYCLNECFEPLTSKNVRVKEEAKNGAFGLASFGHIKSVGSTIITKKEFG